jgi:hypothetical protein
VKLLGYNFGEMMSLHANTSITIDVLSQLFPSQMLRNETVQSAYRYRSMYAVEDDAPTIQLSAGEDQLPLTGLDRTGLDDDEETNPSTPTGNYTQVTQSEPRFPGR